MVQMFLIFSEQPVWRGGGAVKVSPWIRRVETLCQDRGDQHLDDEDVGVGNLEAAEVGPDSEHLGGRGPARGIASRGERSSQSLGGWVRQKTKLKLVVPVLEKGEVFDLCSKQVAVYANLRGFATLFSKDSHIDVEDDEVTKESILARECLCPGARKTGLGVGVPLASLQSQRRYCQIPPWNLAEVVRKKTAVDWYDTKTNDQTRACVQLMHN